MIAVDMRIRAGQFHTDDRKTATLQDWTASAKTEAQHHEGFSHKVPRGKRGLLIKWEKE